MINTSDIYESILPADLQKTFKEKSTQEGIELAINHLNTDYKQLRKKIIDLARSNQEELKPQIEEAENYLNQVDSLNTKLAQFKTGLKEQEDLLRNAPEIDEFKSLVEQIEEIDSIIKVIESIQNFENILNEFKLAIEEKNYTQCEQYLVKLNDLIQSSCIFSDKKSPETLKYEELMQEKNESSKIDELREEFSIRQEQLWFQLDEEWDKLIEIKIDTNDNLNSFISIDTTLLNQSFLDSLCHLNRFKTKSTFIFDSKLRQFGKMFLKFCQQNVLEASSNLEIEIADEKNSGKKLHFIKAKESSKSKKRPTTSSETDHEKNDDDEPSNEEAHRQLENKLNQLEYMFGFLYTNLFNLNVDENVSLMSMFSSLIQADFNKNVYEMLVVNCIPLRHFTSHLETKIFDAIKNFENSLISYKFIQQQEGSVVQSYVPNIEKLFVRKKCKHITDKARELMKRSDLLFEVTSNRENLDKTSKQFHDLYSGNSKLQALVDELMRIESVSGSEQDTFANFDALNLFKQPECAISLVAKKVVELIYETFNEACVLVTNVENAKNVSLLCLVAKNLFDLYACVVPTHHKENLKSLPLLAAICYNDFLYLAFNCLTLTSQYRGLFDEIVAKQTAESSNNKSKAQLLQERVDLDELAQHFTCIDLVPRLWMRGHEILHEQLNVQKIVLLELLNEDFGSLSMLGEENNVEKLKRSLNKCLIHIKHLSSIWLDVLPQPAYFKVFGLFFDILCNDLVKSALKLEDIPSDDASYMHEAFSLIADEGVYKIFVEKSSKTEKTGKEDDEAQKTDDVFNKNLADLNAGKHVASWHRFKYLLVLLKANLQEIVDLWSEGSGPLALYFDSEEIRHLIRALFMITDRRSAALAKIK